MEFCPDCEVRLKKNDKGSLYCPECNYVKNKTDKPAKEKSEGINAEFLVMEESDLKQAKGLESTIKIDCKKCHHQEGVWWSLQTRSADEPETRFYRCTKCNYTWRDYT